MIKKNNTNIKRILKGSSDIVDIYKSNTPVWRYFYADFFTGELSQYLTVTTDNMDTITIVRNNSGSSPSNQIRIYSPVDTIISQLSFNLNIQASYGGYNISYNNSRIAYREMSGGGFVVVNPSIYLSVSPSIPLIIQTDTNRYSGTITITYLRINNQRIYLDI